MKGFIFVQLVEAGLALHNQGVSGLPLTPITDNRNFLVSNILARFYLFTMGARELSLPPTGVSHAINPLADGPELRLFDRPGRSVKLTAAGQPWLNHAHRILDEMNVARADQVGSHLQQMRP